MHSLFGSSSLIVASHLAHITRNDPVKWSMDSFQAVINELEKVRLLVDASHAAMLDSHGIIKKIVARLPKITNEKVAQQLSQQGPSSPDFAYLEQFAEKQLDLVFHPLMQPEPSKGKNVNTAMTMNKNHGSKSTRPSARVCTNVQHAKEKIFKCPVIGCSKKEFY